MKKYIRPVCAALCGLLLAGCAGTGGADHSDSTAESTEESEAQTLTVDDLEYYTRFRGQDISINVYNWGEYISTGADEGTLNVNAEFTKLTGIKVNYTNYATNEELYAKLKGGGAYYDVIIPSDYMISKMIKENMLQPLDMDNIPNFRYIMPTFVDPAYDPDNAYSVPYTWGTVGIIYNTSMIDIPKEDIDWDILWNPDYADQILMFDNPRDAFAIAEIMMGYSLNTEDPVELNAAANKLKEQKSVVQAYVMDEIFDKMAANDAWLAPYYAGDALTILEDNEDLDFAVPKSGHEPVRGRNVHSRGRKAEGSRRNVHQLHVRAGYRLCEHRLHLLFHAAQRSVRNAGRGNAEQSRIISRRRLPGREYGDLRQPLGRGEPTDADPLDRDEIRGNGIPQPVDSSGVPASLPGADNLHAYPAPHQE